MSSVLKMERKKMPEFWDSSWLLGNGFCWKTTMGLRGEGINDVIFYVTMSHTPLHPFLLFMASLVREQELRSRFKRGHSRCFPSPRSATDSWDQSGCLEGCLSSHILLDSSLLLALLPLYMAGGGGWGLGPQQSCCNFMVPRSQYSIWSKSSSYKLICNNHPQT